MRAELAPKRPGAAMLDFSPEHLFSYTAGLHPPEVIGAVADGIRINFHIAGGTVSGPRLSGSVRPVGADFFTLRTDGVGILDVRATVETRDGALICLAYSGVAELGPDGHARFLRNDPPQRFTLRTVMRAQCAHPAYEWLNRLQCFSVGEGDLSKLEVRYDVYTLR